MVKTLLAVTKSQFLVVPRSCSILGFIDFKDIFCYYCYCVIVYLNFDSVAIILNSATVASLTWESCALSPFFSSIWVLLLSEKLCGNCLTAMHAETKRIVIATHLVSCLAVL